jgi:hypothetical protein
MEVNNMAVEAVLQDFNGVHFLYLPYSMNIVLQLLKAIKLFTSLMACTFIIFNP